MTTGFQTGIKATLLVTKKKGMSDEDFEQHYTKVHIPIAADILNRHRVLYYGVQFITGENKENVQALFGGAVGSIDCDAVVTTIFPDMDSLKATFADPEFVTKLHPDGKILTEDDGRMVIGKEFVGVRNEAKAV
ncbi:hypothetical protein TRIATDRAFT_45882 [Trichoderma atroviride IMI 206040]|uniref:EthD domain-containing protein n=1 Tax=Hypocrea atroviridis (strain ATCC 20476 / IMI 206040) TaxID=452589 RepID=G9NR95_HYPAI|nr:uncharacterized protein TRIATDRAFT_45882 [Trichoderma atroviride IMI 206040]EHK47063.1 hypothetical protein TRIATDRAFT_45882 [Trichoderma atroviride IMI 206040]